MAMFVSANSRATIADAGEEILPKREKRVVTLYYEELTRREIGEAQGVTESRVSQRHTRPILCLKAS
jgi:RNA polymerase sigma factor (sigma-70 family)